MIEESIDARGLKCPRPIIELAKLRRRTDLATLVVVTADDLAFESDVRAWCRTTSNELVNVVRNGKEVIATIQFAARTGTK